MKFAFLKLIVCFFLVAEVKTVVAQKKETTTIILTRHTEKDTAANDPGLTPAGQYRATRLVTLFANAKPDEMYSTAYKRTRATLQPWAKATGLTIQSYDAAALPAFAEMLKAKKGKTIVVAGHSNTTPALANLLLNAEKYKALNDNEYNKVFVITLTKGKAKSSVITY